MHTSKSSNAVNDVVIISVTLIKRSNNYIHEDSDSIISELMIISIRFDFESESHISNIEDILKLPTIPRTLVNVPNLLQYN